MMFNIVNKKGSIYADITCKPQVQKRLDLLPMKKLQFQ